MNTNQEKIQALTDKIDELLGGEIKELKKGCRVIAKSQDGIEHFYKWKYGEYSGEINPIPIEILHYECSSSTYEGEYMEPSVVYSYYDPLMFQYCTKHDYETECGDVEDSKDFEIIGRPILAHDILRALGKTKADVNDGYYFLTDFGHIDYQDKDGRRFPSKAIVETSKPLHEQSEQNIVELYKLFFE